MDALPSFELYKSFFFFFLRNVGWFTKNRNNKLYTAFDNIDGFAK